MSHDIEVDTIHIPQHGLRVAAATHVGQVRDHNEDNFVVDHELGLIAVADGMGGHDAGEVASRVVLEVIKDRLERTRRGESEPEALAGHAGDMDSTLQDLPPPFLSAVEEALVEANRKINGMNRQRGFPEGRGMGTTVVGLWLVYPGEAVRFHVGDSRLYRYRKGKLVQMTRDHSLYEMWLDHGGEGIPPQKNVLLRAVGPAAEMRPEVENLDILQGDRLLLCSDGLSGMVGDEVITSLMMESAAAEPEQLCRRLIEMANDHGGEDNVTVIVAARD